MFSHLRPIQVQRRIANRKIFFVHLRLVVVHLRRYFWHDSYVIIGDLFSWSVSQLRCEILIISGIQTYPRYRKNRYQGLQTEAFLFLREERYWDELMRIWKPYGDGVYVNRGIRFELGVAILSFVKSFDLFKEQPYFHSCYSLQFGWLAYMLDRVNFMWSF